MTRAVDGRTNTIPKRRKRHYSYNESLDEPAKLIDDEPVEIEESIPSEDTEPVETVPKNDKPDASPFEE